MLPSRGRCGAEVTGPTALPWGNDQLSVYRVVSSRYLYRCCVSLPNLSVSRGVLLLGHVIFWVNEGGEMQPDYFPLAPTGYHKFPYLLVDRGLCCPVLYQTTKQGSTSALRGSDQASAYCLHCLLAPGSGSQCGNIPKLKRNGYSII